MDEIRKDEQLTKWFSTYGLITAERILGKYAIKLPQDDLIMAIKTPFSFYHRLVQIPLKNIFNGIVLQQASDYHVYAQKLFIDYLLSGETSKGEGTLGALTRESLENERQQLVNLGEEFNKLQMHQNELIAKSQASLIKTAETWKKTLDSEIKLLNTTLKNNGLVDNPGLVRQGLNHALIYCDLSKADKKQFVKLFNDIIKASLTNELIDKIINNLDELFEIITHFDELFNPFLEQTKEMGEQARSYRTQFYDTIIRVTELLKLLPEYKIDPAQDAINREPLYFDKTLGEI